jgi:hypothetical protein
MLGEHPINPVLLATDLAAAREFYHRGGRTPRPRRQGRRLRHPRAKTEDGIADIGFAWAAWIIDPATNALGMLQVKV